MMQYGRLKGIVTAWEINSIFPHHTHTQHTFPVFGTNLVSRMGTGLGRVVLALIWVYSLMNLTSKEYGTNWKKLKSVLAQVKEYLVSTGKNVVGGKRNLNHVQWFLTLLII